MMFPRTKLPRWVKADENGMEDYPTNRGLVRIAHYGRKLHLARDVFADQSLCGSAALHSVGYVGESDRFEVCRECRLIHEGDFDAQVRLAKKMSQR